MSEDIRMAPTQEIPEEQRSHEDLQAENAALKQVLELSLREVERNQGIIVDENKELTEENQELKRKMEEKQKMLQRSCLERKLLVKKINALVGGISKAKQIIAGLTEEVNGSFSLDEMDGDKCQAIPPVSNSSSDQITGTLLESEVQEKSSTSTVAVSINYFSTDFQSQRVSEPATPKNKPPKFERKPVPFSERKHAVDENRKNYCTCGKRFSPKWMLMNHVDYYSKGEYNFQCTVQGCGKRFFNTGYLRVHMKRQHNLVYSGRNGCRKCGRTFVTLMLLHSHQKNVHRGGPLLANNSQRLTSAPQIVAQQTPHQPTTTTSSSINKENAGSVAVKKAFSVLHGKDMSKADSSGKTRFCLCGRQCPSPGRLYIHLHHFASEFNFPCNRCGKRFRGICNLRQHMKSKHNLDYAFRFGCRKCGQGFSTRQAMVKHQRKAHIGGSGSNDVVTAAVVEMEQEEIPTPILIPSPVHPRVSSTPKVGIQYRQASLSELMPKSPVTTTGPLAEQKHAVDESRENFCICGLNFNQKWKLISHVDYFSKNQHKFQCSVKECGDRFLNTGYLRVHMKREHNLVYLGRNGCRKCGQTFSTTTLLYLHQKNLHNCGPLLPSKRQETPVTPSVVKSVPNSSSGSSSKDMGGASAPSKWQRQKGVLHGKDLSKANAQGQTCFCLCGMKFSSSSNLYKHVHHHTTASNFPCAICGERFVGTYLWRKHMKIKHKMEYSEEMIGCRKCGLAFGTRKAMLKHQRKAHVAGDGDTSSIYLLVDESKNNLSELETPTISDPGWNLP